MKCTLSILLLLTVQLFGAGNLWAALVIEFKNQAVVDSSSITLGDIATFSEETDLADALATQIVSQAPGPGQEITLQTVDIARHLNGSISAATGISWTGARKVTVGRNAIQVKSEEILTIIEDYLTSNSHRLPKAEIRFIPAAKPLPFLLPSGDVNWEVIPSSPEIIKSSRFSIIFRVDGRVRKNMSVRGRLEILAPVVISSTSLQRGQVLSPADVTTAVRDITTLRSPLHNPEELIGKRVTKNMKPGAVLLVKDVEFPPVIRKGELVRMVIERGSLLLTATGVARNDGKMNDTIRVQNINSRKIIYCRVAAPGLVEVAR